MELTLTSYVIITIINTGLWTMAMVLCKQSYENTPEYSMVHEYEPQEDFDSPV